MLKCIFLVILYLLFSACSTNPIKAGIIQSSQSSLQVACMDGQTKSGFISPITSGDLPCQQGAQACVAGNWTGPVLFENCDNSTKSCDGYPHGSSKTGYLEPTTVHGVPCPTGVTTCLNGSWIGPMLYQFCQEVP